MKQEIKTGIIGLLILIFLAGLNSCGNKKSETHNDVSQKQTYTCSMHPQVVSDKPGTCPICGMDLVPVEKGDGSGFLTLSEPQQALANIVTDTVKAGAFASHMLLNARLAVDPSQTEFISSRVPGRIEVLYVRQTGEPVRKGQPLYKIYSEQLASLQQEYLIAIAQAAQFPDDKKFEQLAGAAKQKLLLYGQTETQIRQLANKKQTNPFITYTSPAGGTVSELSVAEGQYVAEGSPIMSLEGYQTIWVEADLYPSEANLIKKGDMVRVSVTGFEDAPQHMRVDFIAPSLDPGSQLLTIRGSITNVRQQMKAGMQAVVALPVANTSKAITLPVDAVIHDGKGSHVWVETGVGKFEPRMVETGAENLNRIEIKNGVEEGDVVVVSGAYLLYSEYVLKKGGDPMAGHHH